MVFFSSKNKQMNINAMTGKCLSTDSKYFINVKQLNESLCFANQVRKFKRIFVETMNSLTWPKEICLILGQISLLI